MAHESPGRTTTAWRAALLPGGAVLCDGRGQVKLGLREAAFEALGPEAPDFLRLAAAHLVGRHALDAGLVETGSDAESRSGRTGAGDAREVFPAPDGDTVLLPAVHHLTAELRDRALHCRAGGLDVVPVVEAGPVTYVGPLLESSGSPCVVCLQRAVAPNQQAQAFLKAPPLDAEARARMLEAGHRAWRSGSDRLATGVLELDDDGREIACHPVRGFAECLVCGRSSGDPNRAPPELGSVPRHPGSDTGSRSSAPAEVVARFEHLVSPLSGAVRHVREVDTGAPELIHVYTAGHAVRSSSRFLGDLLGDGRDPSGGKGGSAAQAKASALCEALERFSAVVRGDEVDVLGPRSELEGALCPSDFLLFSEAQYRGRERWNARVTSRFQKVPEPFDDDETVAWSRVWSLLSARDALLPTSLLYFGFDGPGARCCHADSNGLAAGETVEEAVLQGFLEVVERDAVALWWYNRTRQPKVDVWTFDDDYVLRVFEHYRSVGRDVWVLDLTSDLGIPVFAAISGRRDDEPPEVIFGFGAHPDPAVALRRCVTEMNQMFATVRLPPAKRRGRLRGEFDAALYWWAEARLEEHAYLVPSGETVSREGASRSHRPGADILDDVEECLSVARRHGLEVWVRNMTRDDIELPVVKVLVPGLRHFWRRTAPGRLYDVPVSLGRLDAPLDESELNPTSIFV